MNWTAVLGICVVLCCIVVCCVSFTENNNVVRTGSIH